MLPTFVIGLREGLEAALIVGIIAAFLGRQGRKDLLRWVYLGVGTAVVLCAAVGVGLEIVSAHLPQRRQEGLETVVGVLAVGMVSYMVIWMRRHSRQLKAHLESFTADALGKSGGVGAGGALVAMAFLAVLREGFETAVFLLAAFDAAENTTSAATGAILGILVAVALGFGIYRGGVRLNLSKFFRITGLVLVLVAAGLVVNAFHTAHEAGWLNFGQGSTIDLSWLVRPGTVLSSLLTGMLGLQPRPVVIEVVAWLAYLIPVGVYVAWPPGRPVRRQLVVWGMCALAVVAGVVAIALMLATPSRPSMASATEAGALSARVLDRSGHTMTLQTSVQSPAASSPVTAEPTSVKLRQVRTESRLGVNTDVYIASLTGAGASGRPAQLSYAQLAALNGGRLPLGVRPGDDAGGSGSVDVRYNDALTLTAWVERTTSIVVDLRWQEMVHVTAVNTPVGAVPLADPVAQGSRGFPEPVSATAAASAHATSQQMSERKALTAGAWVAGIAAIIAAVVAVLLAFAGRRQPRPPLVRQGEPSTVA